MKNKWIRRSVYLLGVVTLIGTLSGCGAASSKPQYKTASIASELSDFVINPDFNKYEANGKVFKEADVAGILSFSTAKTKRTGESTYKTTVSTPVGKKTVAYLELAIKATTDPKGKEGSHFKKDALDKKGAYNKWFTVTKVKKLSDYKTAIADHQRDFGWDGVQIRNHVTIKGTQVAVNDAYRQAAAVFPIDDLAEFPVPVPKTQSGVAGPLKNIFSSNTADLSTLPAATVTGITSGLQQLKAQGVNTEQYFFVDRLSKSYYVMKGSPTIISSDTMKPTFYIFLKDTNPDDTKLTQLEYVKAVKGQ